MLSKWNFLKLSAGGRVPQRYMFNLRQINFSVVITNGTVNSKKGLSTISDGVQRVSKSTRKSTSSMTTSAAAVSPTAAGDPSVGGSGDWVKNVSGKDEERLQGERGDWWWTGKKPTEQECAVGVSCLPQLRLTGVTKSTVKKYFDNSWTITDVLFSALQGEEAFYRPPYHHLRHPMIFYYGHPTSFYINKLRVAKLLPGGLDPHFEEIFEVGVDEMRWDDISTVSKDWPTVGEVNAYRKKVYKVVTDVIEEQFHNEPVMNINKEHRMWSLMMGIEHEKIHIETSSVLMRELPVELLRRPRAFKPLHESYTPNSGGRSFVKPSLNINYAKNEFVNVNGGVIKLGKRDDIDIFGWDNEYGTRTQRVPDFGCSKFKVSNGEFYEFVAEGGYRKKELWSDDGWSWRVFRNRKWPFFWEPRGPAGSHEYGLRTLFEVVDMQWAWPAVVNYHEATAFCNWKQNKLHTPLRLITEAEHNLLRDSTTGEATNETLHLDSTVSAGGKTKERNIDIVSSSENAVDFYPPNKKGFHDVSGNVWEWCEDDFNTLDKFEVHPYYDDFSAPCFDGEHSMIMGGSFMSCSDAGSNQFCRYHFRPHFLQHSGFRYVMPSVSEPQIRGQGVATFLGKEARFSAENLLPELKDATAEAKVVVTPTYETEVLLNQYLALHYGQQPHNVDATVKKHPNRPDHALNFAERSAKLLIDVFASQGMKRTEKTRALDLGCAVGAASFKLATGFDEVIGVDYSNSFIAKANELKGFCGEEVKFQVPVQGDIVRSNISAKLPLHEFRKKTQFLVGDAMNLDALNIGKFDAVLAANLLCRLPKPIKLLTDLKRYMKKNGVVLFLSPYSWLEDFTARENWLSGEKLSSEILTSELTSPENGFRKIHEEDVPLIIREHERKYQYIISHALAFQKL